MNRLQYRGIPNRTPGRVQLPSGHRGKRLMRGWSLSSLLAVIIVVFAVLLAIDGWKKREGRSAAVVENESAKPPVTAAEATLPAWDGSNESLLPDAIERKVRGMQQLVDERGRELENLSR